MTNDEPVWRLMTAADLGAVCAIAAEIHPDLPERPEVFAEKLRLYPNGCFVLEGGAGAVGYAIAHPWRWKAIPALDTFLGEIPASANCLYLHDAAALPCARGKSAASRLIDLLRACASAADLPALALVSVYGTRGLWSRFGFVLVEDPALAGALASYGASARFMTAPTA